MITVAPPYLPTQAARPAAAGGGLEAAFFGPGGERMLALVERPAVPRDRGVVVCSPLKAELAQNYRRELALSSALAHRGLTVLRFHYRGTGNSEGREEDVTYDSLRADVEAAARWFAESHRLTRLGFVGTRLGGLLAAAGAARFPGSPLALWEPVGRVASYFREVFRYRLISDLKRGQTGEQTTGEQLLAELQREGVTEVCGFAIHRGLYESARSRALESELGDAPHPVLVLQVARHKALKGEYGRLRERLAAGGSRVECQTVEGEIAWWFQGGAGESATGELVDTTTEWLARELEP